jgi:ribosomal protein S18 acetylase RimI-like enzyme
MVTDIHFRAATTDERERCARAMAESDPWLAYQRSIEWCRYVLNWPGSELFVPANGELLGFLLLHAQGFLGNPYIAAIWVAERHRGNGMGGRMLSFAEDSFAGSRFVYLCVSSFNARASGLYERHGYAKIAELPDFVADGYCEVLMRKRLATGT